ncbi:hypothetical protein CPB84DRAFT_1967667 [Gymnopilus junonius]|uniref:DUF6593 domain-containing protein n=1 Tax=Gymnopilus junonius TaxID=109634 RepID=A0A9P5N8C5_GYMJU|nr:hypothetical protein CPB84DRAFT_1967667 [Gymnopilus junonius]
MSAFSPSESTLFNPEPPTILIFSNPSVINNVVFLNGRPLFRISTLDKSVEHTQIMDAQTKEVLVDIRERILQPDTIQFTNKYDGRVFKQRQWLVGGKLENGGLKWTINLAIGKFVWRTDIVHRLALCPEYDLEHPAAYSQIPTSQDPSIPFALLLHRGTEPYREEILASFLIIEQRLRIEEKTSTVASGRMQLYSAYSTIQGFRS